MRRICKNPFILRLPSDVSVDLSVICHLDLVCIQAGSQVLNEWGNGAGRRGGGGSMLSGMFSNFVRGLGGWKLYFFNFLI